MIIIFFSKYEKHTRQTSAMMQLFDSVSSMSIIGNHEFVIFKQRASMGNCKKSNLQLLGSQIQLCFDIHTHCACAFVQNSEEWFVIKQTGHRDSLLFTS